MTLQNRGLSLFLAVFVTSSFGCTDNTTPATSNVAPPSTTRALIGPPTNPDQIANRTQLKGIKTRHAVNPQPGVFNGVPSGPPFLGAVTLDYVQLLPTMLSELIYSPEFAVGEAQVDTVVPNYTLRNCQSPIDPSDLNQWGAPKYDALASFNNGAQEIPQPNQLRFLMKVSSTLKGQPMRLELVNPKFALGEPHVQPALSGRGAHGVNYDWSLPQLTYEVFAAWDLAPEWEDVSSTESIAKVVIFPDYIAGLTDSDGNEMSTSFFARVVPGDGATMPWLSSAAELRLVHVDYCQQEKSLALQAAQNAASAAQATQDLIAYNTAHPPFSVELAGYEPPTLIAPIPGCTDGRFVNLHHFCAVDFGSYKGKGDSFWGGLSDLLSTLNNAFAALKDWVAATVTEIALDFTPAGWACQGLDQVAGTDCKGKMTTVGKFAAHAAIEVGLASLGVPPAIPDPSALINSGADYLAAYAMDTAAEQIGFDIPSADVEAALQNQLSTQVKNSAPAMQLQLQLETLKHSDRTKGAWYPEPLCEQQRIAGASSATTTPTFTAYIRVTRNSTFVGSDKNWMVSVYGDNFNPGYFVSTKVKIPSHWPAGLTSMVIPVPLVANYDYFDVVLGSQAESYWTADSYGNGTNPFQIHMAAYNADVQGQGGCTTTLGVGCAPISVSPSLITGTVWGVGAPPKLTRACNAQELLQVQADGSPY